MLCLESLEIALKGISSEIIVVDNASEDNSQELISFHFPEVKYVQNAENEGFSIANNKGINMARGEYVFLINPDTVISEDAIISAVQKHQSIPHCGILGVQLVDGTGHFLPESKINQLTLRVAALKFLGYDTPFYNHKISQDGEGETSTLVGAFMCFKKEDYFKVEGLDENYFMYGEDIDLSFQFIKKGYKNYYLGKEQILHFKGESTLKDKAYFNRFFTSVKYYFEKHYTNSRGIVSLLSLFFLIAKRTKQTDIIKGQPQETKFNRIICVSDSDALVLALEHKFKKDVVKISRDSLADLKVYKDYIVFDTSYLGVKAMISLMQQLSATQSYFRIKPSKVDVLIGSDSSTSQGEVIKL